MANRWAPRTCPDGVMTKTAELVARHLVLSGRGEARAYLRYKAGHHHGVDVGTGKQKAMHDIGAGEAEFHRRLRRHLNAARYEVILTGDDSHGGGAVRFESGAEIALDKLALEVERLRVHALDIAGRVQRAGYPGDDDDRHHDAEHGRHHHEPAVLGTRDDLLRDDAVRKRFQRS